MVCTIVTFFVLIAARVAIFGMVKFAENVITTPEVAPFDNGTATRTTDSANSLQQSA